jgi:DNA-binding beta-propeller fold protein YncE
MAISHVFSRMTSGGTGKVISKGGALNSPLGLTLAPNGDILAANAGDGNLVEVTPAGKQLATKNIDSTGAGAGTLFGLVLTPDNKGVYFVNDGNNTLNLLH